MINYYHRFIPNCADKLTPLNQLLTAANEVHTRLSPKSNFDLKWNERENSAFIDSKQRHVTETHYSAFDRELLAVYATIRHFRHNLKGRYFFVNTDHKPLTFVMSSVIERPLLRQTRQLAFIAEFTTDIRYVKGETNFVADALSRPSVSFIDNTSTINYKDY